MTNEEYIAKAEANAARCRAEAQECWKDAETWTRAGEYRLADKKRDKARSLEEEARQYDRAASTLRKYALAR